MFCSTWKCTGQLPEEQVKWLVKSMFDKKRYQTLSFKPDIYHKYLSNVLCQAWILAPGNILSLTINQITTCKLGWLPRSKRALTTPICPLLTPMCKGVWRRLFLAFKSPPPRCSISITAGSSPKAAWWTARSPSLSYEQNVMYWTYMLDRHYIKDKIDQISKSQHCMMFKVHVCYWT